MQIAESILLVDAPSTGLITTYSHADAVTECARYLRFPWSALRVFLLLIPTALGDRVYSFIGQYRYHIFGKSEVCYVYPPHIRKRFLE
jgi:predicted DCC family thiol-disulfide oxidoreductase YuxK